MHLKQNHETIEINGMDCTEIDQAKVGQSQNSSNHNSTFFIFLLFYQAKFDDEKDMVLCVILVDNQLVLLVLSIDMSKYKTTQEKTEGFFRTVEAGDIALFNNFSDAVAVFGFTKAGKTSSCHILANSPLRAELLNGELIYKNTTLRFNSAIIGNTNESETQIPNIFETKYKSSNGTLTPITLLDQPGYGDGYGFHRIFSNGYFHYRTFSKTPRLKFVLAFKKADLEGTATIFKMTIFYFIGSFTNYDAIKDQILNAMVFLVTKAEPKTNVENIKKILENIKKGATNNLSNEEKFRFEEVITHMIKNNKIFVIERPEQVNNQTRESNLLKQICEKTTFWQRPVTNGIVDMSEINFSVADEILTPLTSYRGNELFKQDFLHFKNHMNKRIKDILGSLKSIVNMLVADSVGSIESHSFLEGMIKFIQQFYVFNEEYRERREKTQSNLFALDELSDDLEESRLGVLNSSEVVLKQRQEREKEMRVMYFIKKFTVLEFLHKQAQIGLEMRFDRNLNWLQSTSKIFMDMFRKFNLIRVKRSDSQKIVYKYSYVVQRLIEESKIITLILFSNDSARRKFDEIQNGMIDIFRPLRDDVFAQLFEIDVADLKERFVRELDFGSLQVVNKDIILFLETIPHPDFKLVQKLGNLVVRFSEQITDKKNAKDERLFAISKLLLFRNKFYIYLQNIKAENGMKDEKQASIELIVKLSKSLGQLLLSFNYHQQARDVFKTINNADLVFRSFEVQLKEGVKNRRAILIEYGAYAGKCNRKELAFKCLQEAYTESNTYKEMDEVSELMIALETKKQDSKAYLQKIYNRDFCQELPKPLTVKIGQMYQEFKPTIQP